MSGAGPADPSISVGLAAVIVAVTDNEPRILVVGPDGGEPALPHGPLDPVSDPTLELALRRWIAEQTETEVGYVEQLYTFGDVDRTGSAGAGSPRALSIAYLALVGEEEPAQGSAWVNWYDLFPWEDHRTGRPPLVSTAIEPALRAWADAAADPEEGAARRERAQITFGLSGVAWDTVRVLERYELMYQVGLVDESHRHGIGGSAASIGSSLALGWDHRRIAATALGRLRGKLTYRPVVFELLPVEFTLRQLQGVVEALIGIGLHTQNFRRLVETGGLVTGTGRSARTGGRPAELFRFRREVLKERPHPGVGIPGRR